MGNNVEHYLWSEKYRPTTLEGYIFHDDAQRKAFTRMVGEKQIPHLLLTGVAGSGKTTMSKILVSELGLDATDALIINASDENSVDIMRDKIKAFVSSFAMGDFKVVQLEEADYLSQPAQAALRRLMEDFSDTSRFILTANYDHKIIPAIKSRCQHFQFKASERDAVEEYVANILLDEKVKFKKSNFDAYIAVGYPDIRKIVNLIQQHTHNGVLQEPSSDSGASDYKFQLLDLIERDKWVEARKLVCDNVIADQYEEVYRFLYENVQRAPKFSSTDNWESAIVTIADHLYKDGVVGDREINAAAMFIKLGQI